MKFDSLRSLLALGFRETEKQGDEALANGGEGELFDDADETAQAGADDGKHFECDFRVLHAECLKIVARDEGDLRIFNGHGGGGEAAAVEDGQLGYRLAGLVDGEDLLAAVDGGFEDADLAAGDDVEAVAGLVFREEQFAGLQAVCARCAPRAIETPRAKGLRAARFCSRMVARSVRRHIGTGGCAMGKSLSQGPRWLAADLFLVRVTKVAVVRMRVLLR